MNLKDFRKNAHDVVEWMADYLENIEQYPVKSQVKPGEVYNQLPDSAPDAPEPFDVIMKEFNQIIMPGMTHWQHPGFFAYFPANSSPPSVLAEMLTATLAAQGMLWETSPAATELEEKVTDWLRDLMSLPAGMKGVIHDTASNATLSAILTAREKTTNFNSNARGLQGQPVLRIYGSTQTHSSIEKAIKIAGLGSENFIRVDVDNNFAMKPEALAAAIKADKLAGYTPMMVIPSIGTTGSTAIDPVAEVTQIAREHNLWVHVDAAYAGSALLCPEFHHLLTDGQDMDSFVFNPHKWMLTNFDCSVFFVKDTAALVNTYALLPEYLRTKSHGKVNNYCDWSVQLGRRFRALKLWMVIRSYGVDGIRQKIRQDNELAAWLENQVADHPDFELLAPRPFSLVCFRYHPAGLENEEQLDQLNEQLLHAVNDTGKAYMTHTRLNGHYTLRIVVGGTWTRTEHVEAVWELVKEKTNGYQY